MKIEKCLPFLKHPDSNKEAEFVIEADSLVDRNSHKKYPIINGMIDFTGGRIADEDTLHRKKGVLFSINTVFSQYLDFRILTSIFAGGGVAFVFAKRKIKKWIDLVAEDITLFLEPEDRGIVSYIDSEKCITVGDLTSKNVLPGKDDYPNLNTSLEQIPVKTNSIQNIISYFVIEHVKSPRKHFEELARILKPGGFLLLGGPGDVYPSHRTPFNYFNITRFGYYEMIKENNLELVEEYYPSKSLLSILYLFYTIVVRNSFYNKNQLTKILQMLLFLISLFISPLCNMIALLLDSITPFDKKVYSMYLALVRKPAE